MSLFDQMNVAPPPPVTEPLKITYYQIEEKPADDGVSPVARSSLLNSRHFDPDALTPDALVAYVSTRISALDQRMSDVFERQRLSERVRTELRGIQQALSNLEESDDPKKPLSIPEETLTKIDNHVAELKLLDKDLGDAVRTHLTGNAQLLNGGDASYVSGELKNTREYLSSVSKDLESGAQMDMIELQSFMSSRQTAIQLATNLIAALGESQKAVVANVR